MDRELWEQQGGSNKELSNTQLNLDLTWRNNINPIPTVQASSQSLTSSNNILIVYRESRFFGVQENLSSQGTKAREALHIGEDCQVHMGGPRPFRKGRCSYGNGWLHTGMKKKTFFGGLGTGKYVLPVLFLRRVEG